MKLDEIITSYPLTDLQKGMLYEIASNAYASPIYIVQNIFAVSDYLDPRCFIQAFNILLTRHEILRSAIAQNSAHYTRVVYKEIEIPYHLYDYTSLSDAEKLSSFHHFLETDLSQGLDLVKPPLMRLAIFKFNAAEHRLVWTRHHILIDGASAEIIISELFTVYHALLKGEDWILPEPTPFSQIEKSAQKISTEAVKSHWLNALREYPNAMLLPTLPSGNNRLKKIAHQYDELQSNDYAQLIKFVNKHSLTINTVLQGALGITLSHYGDKDHVMLGIVRAYPKDKTYRQTGLFINTLPLCLKVNLTDKTVDYLQDIRRKNQLLREYIDTPLSKIKEWCNLPMAMPLYQCIIDYKPHSLNAIFRKNFPGLACKASIKLDIPYPLVFEIINEEDTLQINLHYDTALFEDYYITALLKHFKANLILMINQIELLSEFPTLIKEELANITNWNKTEIVHPIPKTVHQLFEEQVEKAPSAIAIGYENQTLTYHLLNLHANQLAHHLIKQGVKIEDFIAVCLKPSFDLIIAVLGVLKAGGIYIPIDTQYPTERIRYILEDSQPRAIIIQTDHIPLVTQIKSTQKTFPTIINLDEAEWKASLDTNPRLPLRSSNGMYVIYTSGSTGKPKGVLVEHRAAMNTAQACIARLQITSKSRILQIASFSFDVSVAEWCMALLSGASLYLIKKEIFSPSTIIDALKTYKITTIILSSAILTSLPKEHLPDLKVIAPGGEPCGLDTVSFWAKERVFINVYGITEAGICSTMCNFSANDCKITDIGTPLANTQIYILDRYLRPAPVGATGEIYIAGESIARGYINNDKLNQEKFIFHTFNLPNGNQTVRLYKTGDYGRWLPTGHIECVGRKDEQIKIRGFRVELTEIEQALEQHPAIKKAAVIVRETPLNKQLTAYLLPAKSFIEIDEVREFIRHQLPNFMIPIKFYPIKELPLTPNGKIDKQQLLSLSFDKEKDEQKYSPSGLSKLETAITQVMQHLLQSEYISTEENFLDLGFDSLSLVQLASQLSVVLNTPVNVLDLFTHTNVKDLCAYISNTQNQKKLIIESKNKQIAAGRAQRVVFADEH